MSHSYGTGTDDAHFARAENDWLAAPEAAELLEVYTCTLCGGPIFEGDEYLQVDCAVRCAATVWRGFRRRILRWLPLI